MHNIKLIQPYSLEEIAEYLQAKLILSKGDSGKRLILSIAPIDVAGFEAISFVSNKRYVAKIANSLAGCILLDESLSSNQIQKTVIISANPRLGLAKLLQLCDNNTTKPKGIDKTAIISDSCDISQDAYIGPYCVLGAKVKVEAGVYLGAGVTIGDNCSIGAGSHLAARVVVGHSVLIGKNCYIQSNTVIGSEGFGYAQDKDSSWLRLQHKGGVYIGDNVEIGSNCSIDRGLLSNTVISSHVIMDNLIQIAHNVVIGEYTAIAGCTGIAGSTKIGARCLLGGAVSIAGHLDICDNVHITATSAVNANINAPGIYSSGFPAKDNSKWRRNVARFMSLDDMAKRLKLLELKIEEEKS